MSDYKFQYEKDIEKEQRAQAKKDREAATAVRKLLKEKKEIDREIVTILCEMTSHGMNKLVSNNPELQEKKIVDLYGQMV